MKMTEKKTKMLSVMLLAMIVATIFSVAMPSAGAPVQPGVYTNPVPPGYGFIDFEEGTEGAVISSTIPGLQFTTTLGYDWVYADIRTGSYNARSLTDPSVNFGHYVVNGYFCAWLGPYMGQGRIDFTMGTASYFSVLTSTYSGVALDAYDSNDNLIATSGWASGNLYTYTFTRLTVQAEGMAYIIVHDTGNYWEIDDLVTDAPGVGLERSIDKTVIKKVKAVPIPPQFWQVIEDGVIRDIIVFDPPAITEPVALVRDYAVLYDGEGPIPLELLTWEETEGLPWIPIDTKQEPLILPPDGVAEYDIFTDPGATAVLVRYTVAWASSQGVIETKFVNEAILESESPQVIVGQLGNFDVHNDYHEPVDNFELELYGIEPSDIVDWFPGWGTPPQIHPIPGGTEIIWMDRDNPVLPCQWEHFGLELRPDVVGVGAKAYWTITQPSAELGDVIHTKIDVTVPSSETVTVVDTLPSMVGYINGTFTVDGVPATPTITKSGPPPPIIQEISYTITEFGKHVIKFDVKIDEAKSWEDTEVCNIVTATWFDEAGEAVETKEDVECFIIHPFEELSKSTHIDWPKFHYDLALSGYTLSKAPNTNATLWIYDTGSDVRSSPAIVNGMLYVGALNGKLYALDADTGSSLWNYTTGGAIRSSPTVAGGNVYFSSADGKIYALGGGAGGGNLIWSVNIGSTGWSSPAIHSGNVFIASENGTIFSLDAGTGATVWSTVIGGYPNGPITVVNGKVYSGTHSGNPTLIALNEADGSVAWQYFHPSGGMVNSNGAAVVDGDGDGSLDVYFGVVVYGGVGQAIALNEADGSVKWTYTFQPITGRGPGPKGPGWSTSTPAFHNGVVFIGSDDENVYALNAGTGVKIWNFTTKACVWTAPAVADGKVFVASNDHILYALDELTGGLIWSYNTSASRISGSPAVSCGKVFIGNENGKVYAFGPSSSDVLVIKEKTEVQWTIEIEVTNPFSYTMKNVTIKDNFGAEIEIDAIHAPMGTRVGGDLSGDGVVDAFDFALFGNAYGTKMGDVGYNPDADLDGDGEVSATDKEIFAMNWGVTLWLTGKSDKVHFTWYIGDLAPGKTARLILLVSTDLNPAGHQEYTEPGIYEMNSGATLKFIDPEQNTQLSAVTNSIYVTVLPLEDP